MYYKLTKHNISLIYQKWIKTTKGRVYKERVGEKEKN
jgi:hypothetical protein